MLPVPRPTGAGIRRVSVDLAGQLFVPADGREATCKVLDLSPGGAQIASDFEPAVDTQIILYVDGFGRFEGNVMRPAGGGFGVQFNCSALKRERIAEQLMLYMNRGIVDESVLRRHERAPSKGLASFTRANGRYRGVRGSRSFAVRRVAQDRRHARRSARPC